jgi:hypothetical protein
VEVVCIPAGLLQVLTNKSPNVAKMVLTLHTYVAKLRCREREPPPQKLTASIGSVQEKTAAAGSRIDQDGKSNGYYLWHKSRLAGGQLNGNGISSEEQ